MHLNFEKGLKGFFWKGIKNVSKMIDVKTVIQEDKITEASLNVIRLPEHSILALILPRILPYLLRLHIPSWNLNLDGEYLGLYL